MRALALLPFLALPAPGEFERIREALDLEVTVAEKRFSYRWVGGRLAGEPPTKEQWEPFAKLLAEELAVYSRALVKKTGLTRVVVCRDLQFGGQARSAVPDFARGVLYFDCWQNRDQPVFARRVIHHEYFHIIDKIDDGKLFEDEAWEALNAPDFKYGRGGHTMRDPKAGLASTAMPGFLNRYSTSGVAEDKAEVFAFMMVQYRHVEGRAERDEVIRKKMARMKAILKELCGEVDDSFWAGRRKASR